MFSDSIPIRWSAHHARPERHRYGFLPCSAFEPDFGRHRYQQQVLPLYARRFYSFFMCTHHIRQYTTPLIRLELHAFLQIDTARLHSGCQPSFRLSAAIPVVNRSSRRFHANRDDTNRHSSQTLFDMPFRLSTGLPDLGRSSPHGTLRACAEAAALGTFHRVQP